MPDIKFFHNCEHKVTSMTLATATVTVTRTSNPYDVIHPDRQVKTILEVRTYRSNFFSSWFYTEGNVIISSSDYSGYGHNGITWYNPSAVSLGYDYMVDYIYPSYTSQTYPIEMCPRCGGNGWYIDIINNNDSTIYVASGGRRIAQEFIKMMLTERGTDRLDPTYGTGLAAEVIGSPITKSTDLTSLITSKISETVVAYKDRQAKDPKLPDDERLLRVDINGIDIDESNTGVLISMRLISFAGVSVTANISL